MKIKFEANRKTFLMPIILNAVFKTALIPITVLLAMTIMYTAIPLTVSPKQELLSVVLLWIFLIYVSFCIAQAWYEKVRWPHKYYAEITEIEIDDTGFTLHHSVGRYTKIGVKGITSIRSIDNNFHIDFTALPTLILDKSDTNKSFIDELRNIISKSQKNT